VPEHKELNSFLRGLVDKFGETLLRKCPGFADKNGKTFFWSAGRSQSGYRDGYIVPYRDEAGLITGIQLKRLDGGRYETARRSVTGEMYHVAGGIEPRCDMYLTEGGLKAEVAHRNSGRTIIGVPGQALAPRHLAVLGRLQPGRVIEALDHEANEQTDRARERWLQELSAAGLPTYRAVWDGSDVGGPKGLDDLFASGGRPRIRDSVFVPAATGKKRVLRQVQQRGAVDAGVPLTQARRQTQEAIDAFVAGVVKRR
jgi:hypothetical protein